MSAALNAANMIRVVDNSAEGDAQFKSIKDAVDSTMGLTINMSIVIRAGSYVETGTIEVKKGIEIKGVYSDASLVKIRSTQTSKPIIMITSRNETKLSNLTFEYDTEGDGFLNSAGCIAIEGKCRMENVDVSSCQSTGVLVDKDADTTIENCSLSTNRNNGITLKGEGQAKINRVKFRNNGGHGIACLENSTVEVTGCIFVENGENGIRIESTKSCNITKNKFSKNKREHISVASEAQAVLTANEML
jgi:parallel beta-helix repeat protein